MLIAADADMAASAVGGEKTHEGGGEALVE
jgi:hypothetical protein